MIGWNREFQYLPAKIIGKIVKYQYLPAKTIHFSLSLLTLSHLSHIPPSSLLLLALTPLSITLCHSWTPFICDSCSHASHALSIHYNYHHRLIPQDYHYRLSTDSEDSTGSRLDHSLGAPPGLGNTLASLFHEPGHTCLLAYSHASLQRAELEADYSSVRPSVRPPPRGSSKHMLLHHTVWNSRKSLMYFTVLSYGRPQNTA